MVRFKEIIPNIYQVGGTIFSGSDDCCVYLLDGLGEWTLIDSGVGTSANMIADNITAIIGDSCKLKYIVVAHGHIDHIGGLPLLCHKFPRAQIVAHQLELLAVEQGLSHLAAADWYGVDYAGVKVDQVLSGEKEILEFGAMQLICLLSPGHTVGDCPPSWIGRKKDSVWPGYSWPL